MFDWMAWTAPTATFFIAIGSALVVMTVWELLRPTQMRRGWLPMATSRGDRFFIALLSAAFLHLAWLGLITQSLWIASLLAVIWGVVVMRWG